MSKSFGKYHDENAVWKYNVKDPYTSFVNSITRRNREIAEELPQRQRSTSLASANIKALRLYRHICRMIPYLIKIHEMYPNCNPVLTAKIYLGNHFRANAHLTDLHEIDYKIETGYEMLHDAEWHYTQTGYLYKYLMSPKGILNDQGLNRYDDYRAEKVNRKQPATPFLKKFYTGYKSYEI